MRQCAGQPAFADSGRADQQHVLVLPHPFAGRQRAHELAVQAARMLVIDVLDHAALFQLGRLQAARQSAVLLPEPLLIHQHGEALLEAELAGIGALILRAEGVGHAVQFHGVQFFNRRLIQHGVSFGVIALLQQRGGRIVIMAPRMFSCWGPGLSASRSSVVCRSSERFRMDFRLW